MRKTWNSVINVAATGFPVPPSLTFSKMLATCVLEWRATGFPVHALFALMVGGFSRIGIR